MKVGQLVGLTTAAARNLLFGGNLAALTMVRHPRQMMNYVVWAVFLQKIMSNRRGLPQKNVFEVLPSTGDVEQVQFGSLESGLSWFWTIPSDWVDIVSLSLICRLIKPKVVFEIGTLHGYSAFQFALNTPDESRIYTLDLPRDGSVAPSMRRSVVDEEHTRTHAGVTRYCFESHPVARKITCLQGDSATFDYSPYHGNVDLFFIDGAHSYDYVRSDTLNALACCRPQGVIAWHDFGRSGMNGVSRWLCELSKTHKVYSVPGGSLAYMVKP
ncbi:MAG TPA: class I SAM-dependent methyltransferase [bacterium]|jgi:predicted O-methyltransferase YrrM